MLQKVGAKRQKSSSLSDSTAYNDFCRLAGTDEGQFANFRRNPVYNEILEHMTEEQGAEYLDLVKSDEDVFSRIEVFRENDNYGNPRTFSYPDIGVFSPTTLRYIKVLADLKSLFGSLDDMSICEIGVGYGGQCRVISSFFSPSLYCLVDIAPALMLAEKYLNNFDCASTCTFQPPDIVETRQYDLLISNYAFTELRRSIQDAYLEKVILQAVRGYITYNDINPPDYLSYKKDELLAMIPGSRILDEVPLTHSGNCIIVWGDLR